MKKGWRVQCTINKKMWIIVSCQNGCAPNVNVAWHRYPLCAVNTDWGLLSTNSTDGVLRWRPQAHAFKMLSAVLRATPHAVVASTAPSSQPPNTTDHKYLATAFFGTTAGAAAPAPVPAAGLALGPTINVLFVARAADPAYARGEVLVRIQGLTPGARYSAQAFVLDDASTRAQPGTSNASFGRPTAAVVDPAGALVLPHSYPCTTPSVLRIELTLQ